MKNILFACMLLLCTTSFAQKNTPPVAYDSVLAKKTGADEYGMKKYVMAFLTSGKTEIKDASERQKIQMAHLKNIQRLAAGGKLIVAGPFLDDQPLRGIFIFDVESVEEAKKLTESDPAVKAGLLKMELHPWYGSAALIETVRIHESLQKKNITDQ
jgi:uncharacterized protein YciI